jgi:hypothetical protein
MPAGSRLITFFLRRGRGFAPTFPARTIFVSGGEFRFNRADRRRADGVPLRGQPCRPVRIGNRWRPLPGPLPEAPPHRVFSGRRSSGEGGESREGSGNRSWHHRPLVTPAGPSAARPARVAARPWPHSARRRTQFLPTLFNAGCPARGRVGRGAAAYHSGKSFQPAACRFKRQFGSKARGRTWNPEGSHGIRRPFLVAAAQVISGA